MIKDIREILLSKENLTLVIIIASFLVLFIISVITLLIINAKKKKHRKSLEVLRNKIQALKQHDVIKNYSTYDNLKNDQKLGMLVLRWKKAIENLVREIDAQYSMLDVLEDAINQNNYTYFVSMLESSFKDVDELEIVSAKLNDEITEYVDKASDNRKYIDKYFEMYQEIVDKFKENEEKYTKAVEKIKLYLNSINRKFNICHSYISQSNFEDADNTAALIFKEIKFIDQYLELTPRYLDILNTRIIPGLTSIKELMKYFTMEELEFYHPDFTNQFNKYQKELDVVINKINILEIESLENDINEMESFVKNVLVKLDKVFENKQEIIKNIDYQKDYLEKIENTAKNFISIFKVAYGSYNISDKDIQEIENIIFNVEEIKTKLFDYEKLFQKNKIEYSTLKENLESSQLELNKISKYLDSNLKVIDEIYHDEKEAREKIAMMTEKINGCKKYIKNAYLDEQGKYLKIIKNLNLELSKLYMLLSAFPIDIIRLNSSLGAMVEKVEKTTQEINGIIYKTLLTEFVILYANRFFSIKEYQKELLIAEGLFYNKSYSKAYNRVMDILDTIGVEHKKIVLEKYQEKFSELFG